MGNGKGSTTMAPKACQTKIGCIWDLPGDEDTGGLLLNLLTQYQKRTWEKLSKMPKL